MKRSLLPVLLLSLSLFVCLTEDATAQADIYVRVWADGAQDGGDCSDCIGTVWGVDPRITVRFKIGNSTGGGGSWGSQYTTGHGDQGCDNWDDFNGNNPITSGLGNAHWGDYIHVQMTGYESDGFTCSGDDGNCGGINWPTYNYSAGGGNHRLINGYAGGTCSNGDYQSNRHNCSSDNSTNDYKIRYCYDYYFTNASTISAPVVSSSNQTQCSGWAAPTLNTSAIQPSYRDRQWQVSVNGGAWSNISGATGISYNPGTLTTGGTTTYAYRVYYRYAAAFSTTTSFHVKYSNTRTFTIITCPELGFTCNQWNVNAYQGQSLALTGLTFKGSYTETALTYQSTTKWPQTGSPQVAPGYSGTPIGSDNHTVVYKRVCFPCGYYNVNRVHDDGYRLYVDGNQVAAAGGNTGGASNWQATWTGFLDASSTMEMRHIEGTGNSYQGLQFNRTDYPDPGFGSYQWNVACYDGNDYTLNAANVNREGYYIETSLTYDSRNRWTNTPYEASGYVGCDPGVDNHTVVSKRQGFDCKYYQIDIPYHDDNVKLLVNGVQQFDHVGCCDAHTNTWSGVLGATSTVELRHGEGGGGTGQAMTFVEIAEPVATASVADICEITSTQATFTLSGASLGGNLPYTFLRWEYQTNGTGGVWQTLSTSNPYNWSPNLSGGNSIHVQAVYSAQGCQKTSNVVFVNVIEPPAATVASTLPQICEGTQVTITTTNTIGTFNKFQYQWNGTGGSWNDWGTNNPRTWTPGSTAGGKTLYVRAQISNGVCTSIFYTAPITIQVDDPSSFGTLNDLGPIETCDHAGNIPQISVSGNTGALQWQWGNPSGGWNTWVTGNNAGTCCFGVNPLGGAADRMRVIATNGVCASTTSAAVLIENQNSPPPSSLTASIPEVCAGYSGNITLTANFPYATSSTANVISNYSSVQFYSGSCGGTLLGTVAHASGVAQLSFAAPSTTTTYYTRSTSSCETSTCASATFTVVADPAAPTLTKSPNTANVCSGATVTVTPAGGSGGLGTCNNQYRYSTNNGSSWSAWSSTVPSFAAPVGTSIIESRRDCSGNSCNSNVNSVSWTVVADPTAPTITKSPNVATVCIGAALTVVPSGGTGGAGTCTNEYRHSTNNGSTWTSWSTSIPNISAVVGTTLMQSRRNCNGGGCDIPTNQVSWTVIADPIAPTLTKNPNVASVCAGATLSIVNTGGSGGTGTCTNEYRYSTNNGTNWSAWSVTVPSFAAVAGTNIVQGRRTCTGSGCMSTNNQVAWTVIPDQVLPTLNIATPANMSSICLGGAVSATFNAGSGGLSCTDSYEYSVNGGINWFAYTPGNNITSVNLGTNVIQIRVSRNCTGDGCDNDGPSSSLAYWTVVETPEAAQLARSPDNSVCVGATLTASIAVAPSGGTGTCTDQYRYSTDNGSNWSAWSGTIPSFTAVTGTNIIESRRQCDGLECSEDINQISWSVVIDPTAPPLTRSPDNAVCAGDMLTITTPGGSNGAGTCTDEFRYSTDNGTNWSAWNVAIPNFASVGGTNLIESRRTCTANGCDPITASVNWTVHIDNSAVPGSISGPANICAGESVVLTAVGGNLGVNGVYEWDDDPLFGSPVTTGTNTYTTPVINATTTYYVRINSFCSITGNVSHTVTVTSPSSMVYLIQNGDVNGFDGSTLDKTCEENGWTYYTRSNIYDKYVFAVNWDPLNNGGGHNSAAKANAVPYITVDDTHTSAISTPASECLATFTMARYWNVNTGGNALDGPVLVRFYYDVQEATDIINARIAHESTFNCNPESGVRWFKTQNVDFDPAVHVTPINIIDNTFIFNANSAGVEENNVRYAELLVFSFSGGSAATGTGPVNNPLPVELVSFSATAMSNTIELDWMTLSEFNNDKFELQKSTDGINFAPIAEVAGHGTSSEPHEYNHTDYDVEAGVRYYYRLKQYDFDGTSELSDIVTAMIEPDEGTLFIGELVPNPTVNTAYIDIVLPEDNLLNIRILNMLGQEVYINEEIVYTAGSQRLHIDASTFTKGNYLVSIELISGYRAIRKMIVID